MIAPDPKTFCSSPWFHMRILQTGQLQYCRWQEDKKNSFHSSLTQDDFLTFFQKEMSSIRLKMLQGETVTACNHCHQMEQHNKVSGRERQLLKVGIQKENFAVDRFVELLSKSKKIAYLHFLGGETLITPGFKKILVQLIKQGLHKTTSIGFTTNLTVWDQEIVDLLAQYKEVNLGMSIECFHPINDYLRWPSNIESVKTITEKWIATAKAHKWLMQFRTTPTVFSIAHLKTIYEYAYTNNIGVESCNFLHKPEFMRMSILPADIRKKISDELQDWINTKQRSNNRIINTRHPDLTNDSILQDASSYVDYLNNSPDETSSWPALVSYLKKLENSRGNSILDYAPEYEKLLRSSGY